MIKTKSFRYVTLFHSSPAISRKISIFLIFSKKLQGCHVADLGEDNKSIKFKRWREK